MAGIVKHLNIGKLQIRFVFRHRWEKFEDETEKKINDMTMWREWEFGLFYRRFHVVGSKNFNEPNEWEKNLVYKHMLGINLLICKIWFTFVYGGMHMKIDEN
jgi:hypothetical protein